MKNIFQRLYDSEINFSVSCFWDGGFEVKLGDDMNGFAAEGRCRTWDAVEAWFDEHAMAAYPDSLFATGKRPVSGARA